MGKKNRKQSFMKCKNLDAKSFLQKYYGISHQDISQMTHQTMSAFFPQLQRTSFEHIQKNPELISSGRVILVEDVKHFQAPYLKPDILEDSLVYCDSRELTIQQIVDTFAMLLENNLEGLLIVECEDLLTPYLYRPNTLTSSSATLFKSLISASDRESGILLKQDKTLVGYHILNHGDNSYQTMMLPVLERQAVGISRRTDAMAILYENEQLCIVVEGIKKELEDSTMLRKELLGLFPYDAIPTQKTVPSPSLATPSEYSFGMMSTYELQELMNVYRASNQMAYYHIVRRELVRRTKGTKEYRIRKEKEKVNQLIEGEDYHD